MGTFGSGNQSNSSLPVTPMVMIRGPSAHWSCAWSCATRAQKSQNLAPAVQNKVVELEIGLQIAGRPEPCPVQAQEHQLCLRSTRIGPASTASAIRR